MDEHGEALAQLLSASARAYAAGVVERQVAVQPDVLERYGTGYGDLSGDTQVRLLHLAQAAAAARPALFDDHIAWLKVAMTAREVPIDDLRVNLRCIRDELQASLPESSSAMAADYLDSALAHLDRAPAELPSLLEGDAPHIDLARRYLLAALETRRADAIELVLGARARGVSTADLHRHVLAKAQAEIGRMWQRNEIHVAEEHYVTALTMQVLAQLREDLPPGARIGRRVLCTTVSGDLHDVGAQMVADSFEIAGWDALMLGPSTPAVDLVHAIRDFEADLLALSTSLTLHVRTTADVIRALRAHARPSLPILVGGAPFCTVPDLWRIVGADAHATDASRAPAEAQRLLPPR